MSLLPENAVTEIGALHAKASVLIDDDTDPNITALIYHIPALCQTVRALREQLAAADALHLETVEARIRADNENIRLLNLIDTPHTDDWLRAVPLEAAHQVKRWGVEHDVGKTPWDWFWLIGYLAQKAAGSALAGDVEKAKHHTVSTGAVLLNWFRRLTGDDLSFQPGIDPSQRGAEAALSPEPTEHQP